MDAFYELIQETYNIKKEDSVEKISFYNIIDVAPDVIIYEDNSGNKQKISLPVCAKLYAEKNGISRNCEGQKLNCVGGRFFSESFKSAFYEFFTSEHIRFCLELKSNKFKDFLGRYLKLNLYTKEFSVFYSLQKKLNKIGYTTIDLT